ncbi:MAG: PilZ domain-containing protein [Bdellovibrionaceae bacterium]|nr:PilZ domain-containing protein [Bdellovibrio sp.]
MSTTSPESKWFLQFQGRVDGPLDTGRLQKALQTIGDDQLEKTFLWRRGLTEWMKASKWHPDEETTQAYTATTAAPVYGSDAPEKTLAQSMAESSSYRVQINFVDQPLMTKPELLVLLAKQQDVSTISIQDPRSKEWKEVYAFPDLVERLGLTRRHHQRVPILAQFSGTSSTNPLLSARIITVSEGGLGFTDNFELKIGDSVEGQVTSPHFFQPISIKAEVIYSGLDGYVGLTFTQITDEAKSAIIEYVKKFGKATGSV